MTMSELGTARTQFREAALNFWFALTEKDSDRANEETATCERIVAEWAEKERALEFLQPLIKDEDDEVRLAAASISLNYGAADLGIPDLEGLRASSRGFMSASDRLRLRTWRHEHQ